LGTFAAVKDVVTGRTAEFRVTPKGRQAEDPPASRILLPYIAVASASILAALFTSDPGKASGFYMFCLLNATLYTVLVVVIIARHEAENGVPEAADRGRRASAPKLTVAALAAIILITLPLRLPAAVAAFLPDRSATSAAHTSANGPALADAMERQMTTEWAKFVPAAALASFAWLVPGTLAAADAVAFGVYDPEQAFASSPFVAIDHVFVWWDAFNPKELQAQLAAAAGRHRTLLVTVEPWPKSSRKNAGRLLEDVEAGEYDGITDEICDTLARADGRVFVRWGHEMDDTSGRYPWAGQDPAAFRSAFAHFALRCRARAPNVRIGWSVKGMPNAERYYPGGVSVDFIGIAVFSDEQYDTAHNGIPVGFKERLAKRYDHLCCLGKPIMLAEAGVAGSAAYREAWLRAMLAPDPARPLMAAVYFNSKEPWPWPETGDKPDWRVDPDDPVLATQPRAHGF
jgi:beta-mannanase